MIRRSSWLTMVMALALFLLLAVGCGQGTSPPTATPRDTPTPLVTAIPLPDGWRQHAVSGFHIDLPERWKAVDVDREGAEAMVDMVETFDSEWARSIGFSAETVEQQLKLFAMDSEPAGTGYATLSVTQQSMPFPFVIDHLCAQLQSVYEKLGAEVLAAECGLRINGLDAGRFTIRLAEGPLAVKEYQYFYVQGRSEWAVTLGVDETAWAEYEAVFVRVGESFRVD